MITPKFVRGPAPEKVDVLGVQVSATSYDEVAAVCAGWIASADSREPARYVCVTSVHGVMEAQKSVEIRSILNGADIATPDGMPLVWALRSFGKPGQQRVYGPDLMLRLCREAARNGSRIFLYGGRPDILPTLQTNLVARFPELLIVGSYSPPFRQLTEEEDRAVCEAIRQAAPHIIFVGISTPKQERWMAEHRTRVPAAVMVGVGAAFDFHAGRVRQAPEWMRRNGLEWLFRLSMEPARLWKRYLLVTPRFLPYWAAQKVRRTLRGAGLRVDRGTEEIGDL